MVITEDSRCSIRPKGTVGTKGWDVLIGKPGEAGLLEPLVETGVIFPYTPMLTFTTSASWDPQTFGHTNYSYGSWTHSDVQEMMLVADFTAESDAEAKYLLAVMHFFRSSTKGGFGANDTSRGTPPAVYNFNYLGDHQFKNVPVVITNATITYANDVDYIPVTLNNKQSFVPSFVNISIMLKPQYNPTLMKEHFSVSEFRKGSYLNGKWGLL